MRLRILYVINSLGPGGAERSLAETLPWLLEAGIGVHIVCLKAGVAGIEDDVRALGCTVTHLPPGGWGTRVRALRRLLAEDPVDVVHTTLFDASVVGRLAAMGTGIPVLTSLVNTNYEDAHRRDPNIRTWRLRAVQVVDAVTGRLLTKHFHAVGEAVKESAVRSLWIPPGRITVVRRGRGRARLGHPGAQRRRIARERLGIDPEELVVLNLGRQEHQKGQRYLLEAAAALLPRYERLRFLIAGRPGHATPDLERLTGRLGLEGVVEFLGHREDVAELLSAADVFAFPSLFEGIGGAVIEAMAMALPVVASDVGALGEVVEDGVSGFLVAPGSSESLVEALDRLLGDAELRKAMGQRGMELFEERFTIEQSARNMIALYERVAVTGARTRR